MDLNSKHNNCEKCGAMRRTRSLKRVKGMFLCFNCARCETINMPTYSGKIPKEFISRQRNTKPKIDSIKPTKRISTKGLYISKNEKLFLFKKYQKKLGNIDANLKVKNICFIMNKLVNKLKDEKKSKEEMQKIFVEELEKHIQESAI